ncbi:hypothetical protein D3C87_1420250 [compost metagenome]
MTTLVDHRQYVRWDAVRQMLEQIETTTFPVDQTLSHFSPSQTYPASDVNDFTFDVFYFGDDLLRSRIDQFPTEDFISLDHHTCTASNHQVGNLASGSSGMLLHYCSFRRHGISDVRRPWCILHSTLSPVTDTAQTNSYFTSTCFDLVIAITQALTQLR